MSRTLAEFWNVTSPGSGLRRASLEIEGQDEDRKREETDLDELEDFRQRFEGVVLGSQTCPDVEAREGKREEAYGGEGPSSQPEHLGGIGIWRDVVAGESYRLVLDSKDGRVVRHGAT